MRLRNLAIAAVTLMFAAAAMAPIAMRATAASSKSAGTPNFTGYWVIDRKASDKPPQGMGGRDGGGGGGGHKGGGEWGGPPPGGEGGPPPGADGERRGGGMRRMLPPKMRITTSAQGLAVADSGGTIVQEIRFGSVDGAGAKKDPPQFGSTWKGDKLLVKHETPRGTVTEEFDLDGDGKRLVIETTMPGRDGEMRTMKRVYRKQGA